MNIDELDDKRLFYTVGEVSTMLGVEASTLRFWEKEFPMIKPHRNAKGNRLFKKEDIKNLKMIYHLLKERGMTLDGARQVLRDKRDEAEKDMEIVERLQRLRAMLAEIRDDMEEGGTAC